VRRIVPQSDPLEIPEAGVERRLPKEQRLKYPTGVTRPHESAPTDRRDRITPLRILVLAPQPFFISRGTPIAVRAAVQALADLGHNVDVLTLSEGEDVAIPNVNVHRLRAIPFVRHVPVGLSWQKIVVDSVMLPTARRMLAGKRYDVIHGVEEGAIMAWVLSRSSGVPFVYDMDSHMSAQLREKSTLLAPLARVMDGFESRALRNSTGVLAVCPALAEIAGAHQNPDHVALLPDMPLFDGEAVTPSEEILGLGGVRIVYVGNLEHYQGVELLLDGFEKMAADFPEARLVIVGGTTSHIEICSARVRGLIGAGQVHFLGPRPLEQLGSILVASDILASPRLHGVNTPMKIYSYLESGRAVLATRLRTHTQVLDDSVAHLVDPTPEDVARGLAELVGDPARREALGKAGRTYVRRRFGRERFEARLRDFYQSVATRIGASPDQESGQTAPSHVPDSP
jgi:glycosyltransferase involved in cell wall biosynthesis